MGIAPRIQQAPNEVVSLAGWASDEEFPYGPQGAKPKRIVICPQVPPWGFLIGSHRYLFKEPGGSKEQQIWSEVIAYEIGRQVHVPVPPAFLALGPENGSPGVLVEFFYGHPFEEPVRFVHAIERLQGMGFATDLSRGSLRDNLKLTRMHRVPGWARWWAETLAFDALIGNTDRHSENWGFLVKQSLTGQPSYDLGPAFDNGTSLGFIVREAQLHRYANPDQLRVFLRRGRHHFGWEAGDRMSGQHAELCRIFVQQYPSARDVMAGVLALADSHIDAILQWCVQFDFPIRFTEARAEFVSAQLRARRDAVSTAIGV